MKYLSNLNRVKIMAPLLFPNKPHPIRYVETNYSDLYYDKNINTIYYPVKLESFNSDDIKDKLFNCYYNKFKLNSMWIFQCGHGIPFALHTMFICDTSPFYYCMTQLTMCWATWIIHKQSIKNKVDKKYYSKLNKRINT